MIFLAITSKGLENIASLTKNGVHYIWCGSDVLFKKDASSNNISQFNYPLQGVEKEILEEAIETIKEHHPDEPIWIES